jgi:hypothetical protein
MILSRPSTRQRGASIFSMLVLAIIVGFVFLMGVRTFPSVNEYLTIRKVVSHIMKANPSSPAEIRNAFEKATEIEYSIKWIKPDDLDIKPLGNTGGFRTSFAYNVEIPIVEPRVFLLMKYDGSASSGGLQGP